MGDVVDISSRGEGELVLLCDCGCQTFRILAHGEIECANCDARMFDDVTAYKREAIAVVPAPEEPHNVTDCADESLALRRVLRRANIDEAAAVVVMAMDGVTHTWSVGYGESEEHQEWFQKRVDDMMRALK